jgi:hypothetical protein
MDINSGRHGKGLNLRGYVLAEGGRGGVVAELAVVTEKENYIDLDFVRRKRGGRLVGNGKVDVGLSRGVYSLYLGVGGDRGKCTIYSLEHYSKGEG